MSKRAAWIGLFLGCAAEAGAAQPQPITSLRAIHSLSNREAERQLPVAFDATVSLYDRPLMGLWVQDGGEAIYVITETDEELLPGDRVRVRGRTAAGYRPIVTSDDVVLLHTGAPPAPRPVTFAGMMRGERDCLRVTVRAMVRAADLNQNAHAPVTDLQLMMKEGDVEALVLGGSTNALDDLLDAEVEVTGVVRAQVDGKNELTGTALYVNSMRDVKVLRRARSEPGALPLTPIRDVLGGYLIHDLTRRIRVEGTITFYEPGGMVVLQNGASSLFIRVQTLESLRIGHLAQATGFPDGSRGYLALVHGSVRDTGVSVPIAPQPVALSSLDGSHAFDLVSAEGRLVTAVRQAQQDEYVLISDGHLFSAVFPHRAVQDERLIPRVPSIAPGSKVRVTGISSPLVGDLFTGANGFAILLRSPDDIVAIAPPPAINMRNLVVMVVLLLAGVTAACVWGWTLARKVSGQRKAIAQRNKSEANLERRRSRILEDISGTRPLNEILEEITALVSLHLDRTSCWCSLGTETQLGSVFEDAKNRNVISQEIPSRLGPPHGVLFVAIDPQNPEYDRAADVLTMGARVATLAIETRGMYSDLVHRSEFDQLTEMHNRFSFEKRLEAMVGEARDRSAMFGLIYIDLDEFKHVNDRYGHGIGDAYLQQAAKRMKGELRPGDLLARLGGDEFAALIHRVKSYSDVEEIAKRLERCFDEPFRLQKYVLHGSMSTGVAFYPEDGTSPDAILRSADAAMYVAKNQKKHSGVLAGRR
ncbi:MAG TPA: GGDEF domain-containing protein [Terracidiphilus sp.]|nr:GGDEF domain-containing protein [Terracidiphilus sp.]